VCVIGLSSGNHGDGVSLFCVNLYGGDLVIVFILVFCLESVSVI
jgi:hypothetical protein